MAISAFFSNTILFTALALLFSLFTALVFLNLIFSNKKKQQKKKYHPIAGTFLNQFLNFNRLHHYMTRLAVKHGTYRLLSLFRNEVYTSDPVNVEYIFKTNFDNFGKGDYNYSLLNDLLGNGIFAVDGDKWREQRKVSSHEFSTKVLRDFSSVVFRQKVAQLANILSEAAKLNQVVDIQDLFMKSTLDSIFRVGFGVDLNSMCGSNEEGAEFSEAFDDASALTLYRSLNTEEALTDVIIKIRLSLGMQGDYNYSLLNDLLGNGIFAVDGDKWREQRKVSSHEFSTKVLRDFSSVVFRQKVAQLANILSEAAKLNQVVDIQDLFMKSTLDSIFRVGFGVDLNSMCGSNEEGAEFSEAFDDASALTLYRYVDIFRKIKKFLNIGSEAKLKRNLKIVDDFVYKLIRSKIQQMENSKVDDEVSMKKEDILSRFLHINKTDQNQTYLRDIILNFTIAGKDTTATALSWYIYMLCKHPHIQEKVAEEARRVNNVKETNDFAEIASGLSEEAIEKMHYIHAAITETLRLYPSVPVDAKLCHSDDTFPDGFSVRKGDMVCYQAYAMRRMKSIWGDDAWGKNLRTER